MNPSLSPTERLAKVGIYSLTKTTKFSPFFVLQPATVICTHVGAGSIRNCTYCPDGAVAVCALNVDTIQRGDTVTIARRDITGIKTNP